MQIVRFQEVGSGRGGDIDEKLSRRYTRTFLCFTDDATAGPLSVGILCSNLLPRIGDYYREPSGAFDLAARCRKISPKQDGDNPFLWEITCEYDSSTTDPDRTGATTGQSQVPGSNSNASQDANPLLRPPEVRFSLNSYQKAIDTDLNGTPILNSARDPFDPPIEIDDSRPVLVITQNILVPDFDQAIAYKDAVNSDAFFGQPAGRAKIKGFSLDSQYEHGLVFWKRTVEIEFRPEGWQKRVLDQGYSEWVNAFNAVGDESLGVKLIRDKDGTPVSKPALLDGTGRKLGDSADPEYLNFTVYRVLPFAALSLF